MTNGSATNCLIGSRPHSADVGYLCRHHLEELGRILRDVEDEAVHLSAVPSMQQHSGARGGSPASERAPARLDVIALRDSRTRPWEPDAEAGYVAVQAKRVGPWCLFCEHESCMAWRAGRRRDLHDDEHEAGSARLSSILYELHNWGRLVREERELVEPEQVTITGERDLLSRQLIWCAEQPWIDELYGDMRHLLGQLKARNGTMDEKPVGRCYLPAEDGPCNGPVWVDNAMGHAHCSRCRQTWDGPQLAMLNYELERAKRPKDDRGEPMWTPAEIAAEHGVKVGTIAVWAHRRGVISVNGHYDPRPFRDKATA